MTLDNQFNKKRLWKGAMGAEHTGVGTDPHLRVAFSAACYLAFIQRDCIRLRVYESTA